MPILLCILAFYMVRPGVSPFVGTWQLDSFNSKFTQDAPSFIVATMLIESYGDRLVTTASVADGAGVASDYTFDCALNGTPCRVVAIVPGRGASAVDKMSLRRIDAYTIVAMGMKNDKIVYVDQRVVSPDKTMMTILRKGTTFEGRPYESTIVMMRAPYP